MMRFYEVGVEFLLRTRLMSEAGFARDLLEIIILTRCARLIGNIITSCKSLYMDVYHFM